MARYKLMAGHFDGDGEIEVVGQRKSTKNEIEKWVKDTINACGLDWRVGLKIKFRDSACVYVWRWVKTDAEVKAS